MTAAEGGIAKVGDFGFPKNFQEAGFSGMLINFKYVKPVSDVWSMGATLYFMLTGKFPRNPLRGQDPIGVILCGNIVPIRQRDSKIPKKVAEVIDRALADKEKGRYQTAAEFRRELAKMLK